MPRPIITGTVIRRIDMHYSDGKSKNKDCRITVAQEQSGSCSVYCEHGPAGNLNQGKVKTKHPVPLWEADRLAETIRDNKRYQSNSYQVISDQSFNQSFKLAVQRNPAGRRRPAPPAQRSRIFAESLTNASRAMLSLIF